MDTLLSGYTYTSIFRYLACVGDSLSSGEFQLPKAEDSTRYNYYDKYEYSWGQFLARKAGITVYNFSRGGMTAREYLTGFAEEAGFFKPEYKAQAYILALGVNDLLNRHEEPGSLSDIDVGNEENNRPTFLGLYAKILQKYRKINPDAKFFLVTMPRDCDDTEEKDTCKKIHRKLLFGVAGLFPGTYVLDLYRDGPVHDREYKKNFYLYGHLNPMGYIRTASQIDALIHGIIAAHPEEFALAGMDDLIPTGFLQA